MNIKIIDEKEQFAQCETFEITHLLWGTKAIPKTYGKIACWKEHGFLVEMTCEEADPLRTYLKMNDPVSQDRICQPQAVIEKNCWKICFFLPLELLEEIGGPILQIAGTKIACNFYKVCEGGNAEQIHYASYSPVDVPEPDFHRPEFFETGELQ